MEFNQTKEGRILTLNEGEVLACSNCQYTKGKTWYWWNNYYKGGLLCRRCASSGTLPAVPENNLGDILIIDKINEAIP